MDELISTFARPPTWRVVAAFVVAPFAGTLIIAAVLAWNMRANARPDIFWMSASAMLILSYLSALLFGPPVYLMLRRWMWKSWWRPALAGILMTVVEFAAVIAVTAFFGDFDWRSRGVFAPINMLRFVSIRVACGAAGGMAFGLVGAVGRRSDPAPPREVFS